MTSGRGQRVPATSARHSLGFCANYRPRNFGKSPAA